MKIVVQKGYISISLDGQNRSKKIIQFMNNERAVSGSFYDVGDPANEVTVTNQMSSIMSTTSTSTKYSQFNADC